MEELAPSPAEVVVVTVLAVAGVLATLGLLLALVVRARRQGTSRMPHPSRPTWGLTIVTLTATTLLYFGGRTQFARAYPGGGAGLFDLHGRAAPVYWVAYLVGGGLLFALTSALLKKPVALRWVVGPPALLAALLMAGLLTVLKLKIDRYDARVAARHLPSVPPSDDVSDGSVGVYPQAGFDLAVLGVALLMLAVVLVLAGPHELEVLVALVAGITLLSTPTLIDDDFWALRGQSVERVRYSVFELGGWALAWPLVLTCLAALLVAIPFLPKWWRGLAALAAVAAPGWIAIVVLQSAPLLDGGLKELLAADGYTVAVRRGGATGFLYAVTPCILLPFITVRVWSASRRRARTRAAAPQPVAAVR